MTTPAEDAAREKACQIGDHFGPLVSARLRPASDSNSGIKTFAQGVGKRDSQMREEIVEALLAARAEERAAVVASLKKMADEFETASTLAWSHSQLHRSDKLTDKADAIRLAQFAILRGDHIAKEP